MRIDVEDHLNAIKLTEVISLIYLNHIKSSQTVPKLNDHTHESLSPGSWSINWEDGPKEWALHIAYQSKTSIKEHFSMFNIEPINNFTLGIYPIKDENEVN